MERRGLDLKLKVLGAKNPQTIKSMLDVYRPWNPGGRYREAEPLAITIVDVQIEMQGSLHPDTLWAKRRVVKMWWDLRRLKEGQSLATQVLEEQKAELGDNHLDILNTQHILGLILRDRRWSTGESRNGASSSTESEDGNTRAK